LTGADPIETRAPLFQLITAGTARHIKARAVAGNGEP
jgi:hypothetical protein